MWTCTSAFRRSKRILAIALIWGLLGALAPQPSARQPQNSATEDPRLSDPSFIKVRDEALAAATCADRTNPVGVSAPKAKYPKALIRSRIPGSAITEGIILPNGSVRYTRVMRTNDPAFGKAALEVLKKSRYKAGTCGGKPVPRFVTLTHTFSVQ